MVQGKCAQERWNSLEHNLKKVAEEVCGQLKGGKKCEETWWNEEVAQVIKGKKRGLSNGGKTGAKRIWRHIK